MSVASTFHDYILKHHVLKISPYFRKEKATRVTNIKPFREILFKEDPTPDKDITNVQ